MEKWHYVSFFVGFYHKFIKMQTSFLELKNRNVINTVDGKNLGHITDIVFDVVCAKALGFIVPQCSGGFWGLFKSNKDLFIPFDCVYKIGVDVILVELYISDNNTGNIKQNTKNNIIALKNPK